METNTCRPDYMRHKFCELTWENTLYTYASIFCRSVLLENLETFTETGINSSRSTHPIATWRHSTNPKQNLLGPLPKLHQQFSWWQQCHHPPWGPEPETKDSWSPMFFSLSPPHCPKNYHVLWFLLPSMSFPVVMHYSFPLYIHRRLPASHLDRCMRGGGVGGRKLTSCLPLYLFPTSKESDLSKMQISFLSLSFLRSFTDSLREAQAQQGL